MKLSDVTSLEWSRASRPRSEPNPKYLSFYFQFTQHRVGNDLLSGVHVRVIAQPSNAQYLVATGIALLSPCGSVVDKMLDSRNSTIIRVTMSSSNALRKRDFLRDFLRKPAKQSGGPSVATQPSAPARSPISVLQTNDPSQEVLRHAFDTLAEKEQQVIRAHVTVDISTTIQAAYNAAEKQKNACKEKRWPGSDKADKVLRWLDRFKSVGDVIANVDPVHVGLPWAGIRILLEVMLAGSILA
nr:hypothetical protein CFP56_03192 [Quercus suber]